MLVTQSIYKHSSDTPRMFVVPQATLRNTCTAVTPDFPGLWFRLYTVSHHLEKK